MSFKDKVVLITGASSGIGADAARHLAKLGANVSVVGRNKKRLTDVADQIKQSGSPQPLIIYGDITNDAERIVEQTIRRYRKLDVLINNAGIVLEDSVSQVNMSEFDRVIDTNLRSAINLTKLCVPHLEKTKGNVVNVSSISALQAAKNGMSYCISKAALDQFTKCAALDLAEKGIRVNSINPADIRTPIFETNGLSGEFVDAYLNSLKAKYLVGRVGEVSDTSAAIAYLADNNVASFLTGIILPVDGGAMIAGN